MFFLQNHIKCHALFPEILRSEECESMHILWIFQNAAKKYLVVIVAVHTNGSLKKEMIFALFQSNPYRQAITGGLHAWRGCGILRQGHNVDAAYVDILAFKVI